jgi:hypothetical protein
MLPQQPIVEGEVVGGMGVVPVNAGSMRPSDIKLLYSLREGLALFELGDPSAADTLRLLRRLPAQPAMLSSADGRKMLSYVMRLHPSLTASYADAFKNLVSVVMEGLG